MIIKRSILAIAAMLLCLSRGAVAFRLPSLSMAVANRSYTHLKNKLDESSHLYKAPVKSDRPKKVEKIVVDPKSDYKFRDCRVFVDNIPRQATWKDLKDHFREAGVNYVSISKDPATGESKGCGIVQFDTVEQSTKAVVDMQGSLLKGSPLKVWLDRKRDEGKIEKTMHSIPNSSKLRGDIKSSSELEAFKRERSGKPERFARDEEPRFSREREGRDRRDGRQNRDYEPRSRDDRGDRTRSRDDERDRRPARQDRDGSRYERADRDAEPRSRGREDRYSDNRSAPPARPASPPREKKAPPAQGDVDFKFTPSFFKRDPSDTTILSAEERSEIEFLVDSRADCRDYGNYENADKIRLRLRNDFRVQCDDVKKMWRILSPLMPDGTPRPTRAL